MSFDEEEVTLSFIAEWFDPHPQVMNKFLLKFYPKSQEVEMKDLKGTRKFLKKTKIKKYATKDFFLNAVVVIFSRDLTLVSYGDDATRALLEAASEKALVVLTKESNSNSNSNSKCSCEEIGTILSECEKSGSDLTLVNLKMFDYQFGMNQSTCSAVGTTCTREHEREHEHERGSDNCISGVCIEFRGNNSYSILEKILLGTGGEVQEVKGVVLPSASDAAAKVKAEHFCKRRNSTAKYDPEHSTCCVIKPHAVKSRMVGKIVNDIISRGLDIYAMEVVTLDRTRATEFSEVYRGLKEYNDMVDELCSGPMLALEIGTSVEEFRMHCGPVDVDIAKSLQPDTIRAKFGTNRIQNAVHCTDLKEDNLDELGYLFDILASGE